MPQAYHSAESADKTMCVCLTLASSHSGEVTPVQQITAASQVNQSPHHCSAILSLRESETGRTGLATAHCKGNRLRQDESSADHAGEGATCHPSPRDVMDVDILIRACQPDFSAHEHTHSVRQNLRCPSHPVTIAEHVLHGRTRYLVVPGKGDACSLDTDSKVHACDQEPPFHDWSTRAVADPPPPPKLPSSHLLDDAITSLTPEP